MSRQHDKDKSFPEKFRQFIRSFNKAGISRSRSDESIVLTEELVAELGPESLHGTRVKAVKEFADLSKFRKLESYTIEKLWSLLCDLLLREVPVETRHLVLGLFESLCKSQLDQNGFLRAKFFAFIQAHDIPEDTAPRFEFLRALTENGRDMAYFDEKIGPFILSWMPNTQSDSVSNKDFMVFLVNVIKFNQSFLDQEILSGIIQNVCFMCCTCTAKEDVLECLQVLSAVVCYPSLPPGSLSTFLATLCRTVNVEFLCQPSWKIMRDLLGTHLGHSGLLTMYQFMETGDQSEDVAVIRGSVFFVGVALWGNRVVRSLKFIPFTVLSSFLKALEKKHPLVSYEVIMRIQDLVKNRGDSLQSISWDLILTIVEQVVECRTSQGGNDELRQFHKIIRAVNETLDTIETAVDASTFCGSVERFYTVSDACARFRSDASVEKLLIYKVKQSLRTNKPTWLNNLINFTERHYRQEIRSGIKVRALSHIANVCIANADTHEEDLIEKVILPYLRPLETESDSRVRQQGVKFIVDFMMESRSKKGHDLLHILERIVNRPFDLSVGADLVHIFSENEVVDVYTGVQGLIKLFQKKIYCLPSSIAITAYKIIIRHLANHYKKPATLDQCQSIRYMIFECFFKIRANSMYHLGFPDSSTGVVTAYSPYLAVDHRDGEIIEGGTSAAVSHSIDTATQSLSPWLSQAQSQAGLGSVLSNIATLPTVTFISLTLACQLVVSSLRREKDWKVLEIILKQVPSIMENKALILSKNGNDIDVLANALCAMMMDKSVAYPESLRNIPPKFQRSDFQGYLYPILSALVSYHCHLESSVQLKIVKCLEYGLVSKSSRICILSLSTCTLEMKDTMHKLLPEVLLSLSKISPKVSIAIPVLEFLSTLIHLPRVFASFVQDQYMSIFAIALPYTNPFKFSQYTVSLAHHVIAMWFLKCRLSFRRGFVSYIIKGLKQNVWAPFDEEIRRSAIELQNEDSSNRKRSSSLTEQSHKRRERAVSGHSNVQGPPPVSVLGVVARASQSQLTTDLKPAVKKAMKIFHDELTETCVDLLARYAFADCSAIPTRFPSTNFLLQGGHSQTWLMDNKIITVTTSGCTQKELREGLCDKCWLLCRKPSGSATNSDENIGISNTVGGASEFTDNGSPDNARRRHRSAFAGSQEGQTPPYGPGETNIGADEPAAANAKDDLHLEHKLQLPVRKLSMTGMDEARAMSSTPISGYGQGGGVSDWTPKPKSDLHCTCWCQGWAEIHVRRPTGNTSWMMRVQNQLGNSAGADLPLRELSAMFLRNIDFENQANITSQKRENALNSPSVFSPVGSVQTSPTRDRSMSAVISKDNDKNTLIPTQDSSNDSSGSPTKSSNSSHNFVHSSVSFSSPTEPGSPTEISNNKNPVRRSNSSPEMSDSWKNPFTNQHDQIQEQDENEITSSTGSIQKLQKPNSVNSTGATVEKRLEEVENVIVTTADDSMELQPISGSSSPIKIGNTSPYRRSYEAIPEEVLKRDSRLPLSVVRERGDSSEKESEETLTPLKRNRTSTITVMSPAVRNKGIRRILSTGSESYLRRDRDVPDSRGGGESSIRSGMNPSFIFLQLCAQGVFGQGAKPLLLPPTPVNEKSLKVLDYIPPYETHKIGVLYVGPGQAANETAILQNQYGSTRYRDFLQGLGTLIKLRDVDPQKTYIGGLGREGSDGEFAYIWQDDVMQVIFHVATLMPSKKTDPSANSKKLHIGNDYVAIVYNNSEEEYDIASIKGQFLYACVIIQPLDHKTNRVIIKAKPVLSDHIGHTESKIVSDQNLPVMARQLALHSNLASVIFQQRERPDPYASNWLERLRNIKRLRARLSQEVGALPASDEGHDFSSSVTSQSRPTFSVDDFTEFV